jgi:hypothetical protein
MSLKVRRFAYVVPLSLIGLVFLGATVGAQSVKVEGVIKARKGDTMVLQTPNASQPGCSVE